MYKESQYYCVFKKISRRKLKNNRTNWSHKVLKVNINDASVSSNSHNTWRDRLALIYEYILVLLFTSANVHILRDDLLDMLQFLSTIK